MSALKPKALPMVEKSEDDDPTYHTALLALDDVGAVIIIGKPVDLAMFGIGGKTLGFISESGGAAVLASRTLLVKALAELDDYDARTGRVQTDDLNLQVKHVLADVDDEDEDALMEFMKGVH